MYKLIRNLLFLFPPETVHHFSMQILKIASRVGFLKKIIRSAFVFRDPRFEKKIFKLHFSNPVGLGAGFDKNALYLNELETLGFGFVEIGTVTPVPQQGNEKPRLFRLPMDKALINRMGFNNDGVIRIAERIRKFKLAALPSEMLIGGNIGKNKITPNEDAWKDYAYCFRELSDCVDYFVVNVSSPNTPGLRELQEKEALRKILTGLQAINSELEKQKPLLLKIAPDLSPGQVDDLIDLAAEIKLDGLVVSNTTIDRSNLLTPLRKLEAIGMGGLSGAPLKERSTALIAYIHRKSNGSIPILASGGIFSAVDAREKLDAGASLIQIWTGFIYEGPGLVKKILAAQ
jgi:dihydroorotate dehydrogenase